jgi:E3 ubiquitin-protein ligase ZNF598
MATQTTTQTHTRGTGHRGRRGNRGRGGNTTRGSGRGGKPARAQGDAVPTAREDTTRQEEEKVDAKVVDQAAVDDVEGDDAVCWICAEPVKYYALSECGHRTCHVCALRLRALYKKMECTFCKVCRSLDYRRMLAHDASTGAAKHGGLHCVP